MTHWRDAPLETWVQSTRLGIITDVDGTISPIADTPDAAQVTPRARELLDQLSTVLQLVAVISGRAAADVQKRVGVPGMVYVGNHGMERWVDGSVEIPDAIAAYRPQIEAARDDIQQAISDIAGMHLEDKGATLSLHYRQVTDHAAILEQFRPVMDQIERQHNLKTFEGRMIFEIRPPVEANKGTAFRALVEEYALDAAVYIGDDTTDIDAINAAGDLRTAGTCTAYGIGVQADETPAAVLQAADFIAEGIPDVEAFFAWVLTKRTSS